MELHSPLLIGEREVERVKHFKFLGVHISDDITSTHNIQHNIKKSHQRLYFLRRMKKFGMPAKILSNFYRGTIESILTSSIAPLQSSGLEGSPTCYKDNTTHFRSSLPPPSAHSSLQNNQKSTHYHSGQYTPPRSFHQGNATGV